MLGDFQRDEHALSTSRRRLLAAMCGVALGAGAGCSAVTEQEYEATPVGLSEEFRSELKLAEAFRDSQTETYEQTVAGNEVSVSVTSEFAGYNRAVLTSPEATFPSGWTPRTELTLVERFVGLGWGAELTPGSGSAINAVASELSLDPANPEFIEGDTPVDPDRITLVIPERARRDGSVTLEEVMAFHHADALPVEELTISGGNNYLVEAPGVLPPVGTFPSGWSDWTPSDRWLPTDEANIPEDPSAVQCLVCLGERSPQSVFGVEEMPGRRLDEGETHSTENLLLFVSAQKEYPMPDEWLDGPETVLDAGYPAPVRDPSYGVAVISTPNAEVSGESVNPLARLDTEEFLTNDQIRGALTDAGLTDAEEVEWLRGPEQISITDWGEFDTTTVLDEEVGIESYAGVLTGDAGPWAAAVHLARATPDDAVIAAAMHRRPVGTADGRELVGDGTGFIDREWTIRNMEFTVDVFASLKQLEDAG